MSPTVKADRNSEGEDNSTNLRVDLHGHEKPESRMWRQSVKLLFHADQPAGC